MRFLERPGGGAGGPARRGRRPGTTGQVQRRRWPGCSWRSPRPSGRSSPARAGGSAREALPFGVLAAVVAGLVYLPWFNFVERTGGYASLMAHHRGYVDGPVAWPRNWRLQMDQVEALAGLVGRPVTWASAAMALGWLGGAIGQGGPDRPSKRGRVVRAVGGADHRTRAAGGAGEPALVARPGEPAAVDRRRPARTPAGRRSGGSRWRSSTPLYRPYARLWLPEVAAGWVAVGGLAAAVLGWLRGAVRGVPAGRPARITVVGLLALVGLAVELAGPWLRSRTVQPFPTILGPSDGVRLVAERLKARLVEERARAEVAFYARQSLPFYLAEEGLGSFRMAADLPGLVASAGPGQVAVVDAGPGGHARRGDGRGRRLALGADGRAVRAPRAADAPGRPARGGLRPGRPAPRRAGRHRPASAATCTFWIFRVGSGLPAVRASP